MATTKRARVNKRANTPTDQEIGLRIRAIRVDQKLSQDELGKRLNVSFQQIQKYERGSNRVPAARLMVIAKVLETTPHELMGWDGPLAKGGVSFDNESYKLAKAFAELPDPLKSQFRALINSVISNAK